MNKKREANDLFGDLIALEGRLDEFLRRSQDTVTETLRTESNRLFEKTLLNIRIGNFKLPHVRREKRKGYTSSSSKEIHSKRKWCLRIVGERVFKDSGSSSSRRADPSKQKRRKRTNRWKMLDAFKRIDVQLRETKGLKREQSFRWIRQDKKIRLTASDHLNYFADESVKDGVAASVDGLDVTHDLNQLPIDVTVRLWRFNAPEIYAVDPDLAAVVGIKDGSWSEILSRFWSHARREDLLDRDRNLIRIESPALQRKMMAHVVKIEAIEKKLRQLLRPEPKIELSFLANGGEDSSATMSYAVPIRVPRNLHFEMSTFVEKIRLSFRQRLLKTNREHRVATERAAKLLNDIRWRYLELSSLQLCELLKRSQWHSRSRKLLQDFLNDSPKWIRDILISETEDAKTQKIDAEIRKIVARGNQVSL